MILRRFIKHVSEQNWFAVGIDVLVVILGVYIGVYLSNLSEERSKQKDIIEAINLIEKQLLADLENLEYIIDYRTNKLSENFIGIEELNKATPNMEVASNAIYKTFRRNYTFFPNSSGYSGIKERGFLPYLKDAKLELTMSNLFDRIYVRHTVIADENDDYSFNYNLNFIRVYLDFKNKKFISDPVIASARLRGALEQMHSNSEWYIQFLKETVLPELRLTLDAIDKFQAESAIFQG